ncbi:MAG: manganese efflux pump MntP family protein [Armatimonadota bacterium]
MSGLEIAALALALAIDAFSVAASAGPKAPPKWGPLRMAASFGLFQAGMPLLGALVGAYLIVFVRAYDHWLAFGLLELVGAKMIYEAFRADGDEAASASDPSRGIHLLSLSIATSIDAFGAGLGLRLAGGNVWVASPVIGGVCAALTYVGAGLGVSARKHLGRRAEVLGGLVLIGLGIKMLGI